MPARTSRLMSSQSPLVALALAGIGQAFLAQADRPWTLVPGLLFYAAALWLFSRVPLKPSPAKPLSRKTEFLLFFLILAAAFFFRIVRIDSLPAGMHTDQGLTGLCALRILHEGWRPFAEVFDYEVPEVLLFYQLAGWFGLVGSSYFKFHLFFILLSLAAFPFVYWTIRQWAGPRAALLSLFFLAVMRWNWIMTRNGYPSIQVPFYLFGALAFWTYGLRQGKRWAFYVSALFVGAGFYTYQAFKIVPLLMLAYAICEYLPLPRRERVGVRVGPKPKSPLTLPSPTRGEGLKKNKFYPYIKYFLLVLILITPLLTVMAQKGRLGYREQILFLGTQVAQEKSLKPVWDVWTGTALMFNRKGDENARHNIPGHRMLDDGTGVLFVLGLALCWRKRKEPGFFYPLVGFGVMALTNLLTTQPAHANRLVSLTPFVAFFAGSAGLFFWDKFKKLGKFQWILGALLLSVVAAQNSYTYFVLQAGNEECRISFGVIQKFIGCNIEADPAGNKATFFVPASFYGNHTVAFLSYPVRDRVKKLDLQDWASQKEPKGPAQVFVVGDERATLEFLELLHPELQWKTDRTVQSLVWTYQASVLKAGGTPWSRGLKGSYFYGTQWGDHPWKTRIDPLLNFDSKFEFPFIQGPPFRIRWTGNLELAQGGEYRFEALTNDSTRLWLDGREIKPEEPLTLKKGTHSIRLELAKDSGNDLVLTLTWKKPGDPDWDVVPATAFGKAR